MKPSQRTFRRKPSLLSCPKRPQMNNRCQEILFLESVMNWVWHRLVTKPVDIVESIFNALLSRLRNSGLELEHKELQEAYTLKEIMQRSEVEKGGRASR